VCTVSSFIENMKTLWKWCSMTFLKSGIVLQLTCPALLCGEAWGCDSSDGMPKMAIPWGASGPMQFCRN
jgi:hypothetical protein